MFRQVAGRGARARDRQKHPYYHMFRWGANANLARLHEAKRDDQAAIAYYTRYDPTSQYAGNLLRARSSSRVIRFIRSTGPRGRGPKDAREGKAPSQPPLRGRRTLAPRILTPTSEVRH